ncbi:MAG: VanZ family protein [Caulobacterales bacterium]|nr:VanZ family protein [Caulobacterales bacterium]
MVPSPLRIAAFALACAVIAWLSLAPSSGLPSVTLWDKAEHAGAYFGLTMIGVYAFPHRLTRLAAGLFLGGVGIEILQSMMELGRQGDPADALANTAGIAAGLVLTRAIRELIRVKSPAGGE